VGELVGFLKRLAGFLSIFALLEFVFRYRWLMPVLVFAFVGLETANYVRKTRRRKRR